MKKRPTITEGKKKSNPPPSQSPGAPAQKEDLAGKVVDLVLEFEKQTGSEVSWISIERTRPVGFAEASGKADREGRQIKAVLKGDL